ncbi:radical SAM protein [Candidatus Woesearchaeota archaeon]|nr:radical SAM protein [Candidatus Woesearchaeota archaeon]
MTDVLLFRPNYEGIYTSFKTSAKVQTLIPPTSLMYVASGLERAGFRPKIVDLQLENKTHHQLRKILERTDAKVAGVTTTTPEIQENVQLLDFIKRVRPDIKTVMGGPHPTLLPDDAIRYNSVDAIFKGEGELEFPNLINAFVKNKSLKKVGGISYKEKGRIIHNRPARLIDDLDSIPFPAWHLIKYKDYLWPVKDRGIIPGGTMLTTRGCPYRCVFCGKLFGRTVRFRSPDSVLEELKLITDDYGIKFFIMLDETFTLKKDRVIEICKRIVKEKIDITWFASTRANICDLEMFRWMKKAGCDRITMGVESGSQKILNILKKDATLKQYEDGFRMAKKVGFETRGSFIIGNPYDTLKTIRQSINFAKRIDLDEAYFNIMTPYPGTELYDMALKGQGLRLVVKDWRKYRRWGNAVIELDGLKPDDLVRLQKKAHRSFYFRPKPIMHQLRRMGLVDTVKAGLKYITAFI